MSKKWKLIIFNILLKSEQKYLLSLLLEWTSSPSQEVVYFSSTSRKLMLILFNNAVYITLSRPTTKSGWSTIKSIQKVYWYLSKQFKEHLCTPIIQLSVLGKTDSCPSRQLTQLSHLVSSYCKVSLVSMCNCSELLVAMYFASNTDLVLPSDLFNYELPFLVLVGSFPHVFLGFCFSSHHR